MGSCAVLAFALTAPDAAPRDVAAAAPGRVPDQAAPAGKAAPAERPAGPVTLRFAGDVNVEGSASALLDRGEQALRPLLSDADVTMVNLETAVTERGSRAPKQFTFRAPVRTLDVLSRSGVDVASLANNHGMDYGADGLTDTLAAAADSDVAMIGIGGDEASAYAPEIVTVRGQRIAFLAATQVLDSSLAEAWTARGSEGGLASAVDSRRLLEEVRRVRADADTVVVYLHWGQERNPCPLPRQGVLARELVEAGADVIVGGHAHVLLGGGFLGPAYVDYGLGNFVFSTRTAQTSRTGVLTLTVEGRRVTDSRWTPAVISGGLPRELTGAERRAAVQDKAELRSCTDLTEQPGPR